MTTTYEDAANVPEKKTRGITAHVTETFYDRCVTAAGSAPVGEWARDILEAHIDRAPFEQKLMEELWALRYILLNGLPHAAANQAAAAQEIHTLIAEAEHKKTDKAKALLKGTR